MANQVIVISSLPVGYEERVRRPGGLEEIRADSVDGRVLEVVPATGSGHDHGLFGVDIDPHHLRSNDASGTSDADLAAY
jgi:hypothetical protein